MRLRSFLSLALLLGLAVRGFAADEPKTIVLWPEGVPGLKPNASAEKEEQGRYTNIHYPSMVVYAPPAGKANGTAVIYAAGGGYVRVAAGVNGGEVTRWLNSLGITVFMLKYRHVEYGQPAPLQDAVRAVRILRSRAAEFGIQPDKIGLLGGSAGAHLTASASTMFDAPEAKTGAALDKVSGRPDFAVLIFPVITMQDGAVNAGSRKALLGDNPTAEMKHRWSPDEQVTKDTSPTFLIHSSEDSTAVVENSLLYYAAMRKAKAPIEMHLYPKGPHGSGMDPRLGPTSEWPKHCELWMRFNGWLPKA